jgi:hypothetical protein
MTEVWAGMATLSERAGSRAMSIDSLLPQVDRLIVTLGDTLGDQAKFAACPTAHGDVIFLGVDDDIVYPPDYVETIVAGLARYPGCIVSFHGWTMDATGERVDNYRCLEAVEEDVDVHVAGTGVCAFRVDAIRPTRSDFETKNADVWLALKAARDGIPRVVLAHPARWFGYYEPMGSRTMWTESAYKTGSPLDASEGRDRCIAMLAEIVREREPLDETWPGHIVRP